MSMRSLFVSEMVFIFVLFLPSRLFAAGWAALDSPTSQTLNSMDIYNDVVMAS